MLAASIIKERVDHLVLESIKGKNRWIHDIGEEVWNNYRCCTLYACTSFEMRILYTLYLSESRKFTLARSIQISIFGTSHAGFAFGFCHVEGTQLSNPNW